MTRKVSENIEALLQFDVDIKNRVIFLSGDIDSDSSNKFIKNLHMLATTNSSEPISVYINSFGGDPYSAFAMYDAIKALQHVRVDTYCIGTCMSAGLTVFLAGDRRIMFENSVLMAHTVSSLTEGKLSPTMEDEVKECGKILKQMCTILQNSSHKSKVWWAKQIQYKDNYIRSEEALKLGLITEMR